MNKLLLFPLMAGLLAACSGGETPATYSVVPLPQEINLTQAAPFRMDSKTAITFPAGNELLQRDAEFLADYVREATGQSLTVREAAAESEKGTIALLIDPAVEAPEGYRLTTTADGIRIAGQTAQGVFYGVQTLRKAMPAAAQGAITFPVGEVNDAPCFGYRGMHLDVCRHFFPMDFIKKFIDLLALHNMNTFHWHLTEDQGWRLEIKKYPRLTEVGSVRKGTVIGRAGSGQFDDKETGGFYTQEEAREIVAYAAERYITVIPEIDLPGHMLGALAAYPSLGCTGGPYEVSKDWGIFEDVLCLGNDSVFTFLEDVFTEVMEVFPSKYIHIGGDEAPRDRWKTCPKCQARIRKEGLKGDKEHTAEDRLQSYCMTRVERFLNEHGRQIIGWDEILEGGIAPNATIMSWRGSSGGIKAAKMGHDVVMTPNTYCYFDYYQSTDIQSEPLAIGGYLPVEKVYACNPTDGLTPEQATFIKGVQANVWTEYIPTTQHVEYMVLPRMAALAEVQWTPFEKREYADFTQRLLRLIDLYQRDGLNYAKHLFHVDAQCEADTAAHAVVFSLSTVDKAPIHYTLDGSEPTQASPCYSEPLRLTESADLRAVAIRPVGASPVLQKQLFFSKSTTRPIRFCGSQPQPNHTYGGAATLVDGLKGIQNLSTGAWLGFKSDVIAVIDLGQSQEVSRVATETYTNLPSWIMGCSFMEVALSDDDRNYRVVASQEFPWGDDLKKKLIEPYELTFAPAKGRYVRVTLKPFSALPKGHSGAGNQPYLFVDEITVD